MKTNYSRTLSKTVRSCQPATTKRRPEAHLKRLMRQKIIQIKVKPNSRTSVLEQKDDGTWLAQLKSAPVEGKANEELLALVAKHFDCRKSAVSIKAGASGRMKLVQIEAPL